jgi:hypothetical protein
VTEETSKDASFLIARVLPESTVTLPSPEMSVFVSDVLPAILRVPSFDTETDEALVFVASLRVVSRELSIVSDVVDVSFVEFKVMLPTELLPVSSREPSVTAISPIPDSVAREVV